MRVPVALAVVAAALLLDIQPGQASGNAPWCAVISFGRATAYWDCQYRSVEQCAPNVATGNRGFCNPNPAYVEPASKTPRRKRALKRRTHCVDHASGITAGETYRHARRCMPRVTGDLNDAPFVRNCCFYRDICIHARDRCLEPRDRRRGRAWPTSNAPWCAVREGDGELLGLPL